MGNVERGMDPHQGREFLVNGTGINHSSHQKRSNKTGSQFARFYSERQIFSFQPHLLAGSVGGSRGSVPVALVAFHPLGGLK